jgi:hypothetical protein
MNLGQDLLLGKISRQVRDLLLLRGEVFQRENIVGVQVFDEEAAPGDSFRRFRLRFYDHCSAPY